MLWFRRRKQQKHEVAQELWKRGSLLLEQNKVRQALTLLRRAAELEPSRLDGRLNLGTACFMDGQFDEAVQHFNYVLAIDPQEPTAMLNMAAAHDAKGDADAAIAMLEQLVAARPKWRDAHYNLAIAYLKKELYEKAENALKAELQLDPKNDRARTLLNNLYLRIPPKKGRKEEG